MNKNLQTAFHTRQYMLSKDFELYYYSDSHEDILRSKVKEHTHTYYEFYFFLEGNVSIQINGIEHPLKPGNMILIPPGTPHRALIHTIDIPYRRFVFWISESFCRRLEQESPDYMYIMKMAQTEKFCVFYYDIIAFNALQSRIFQLLEEIHSDRFGKTTKISLCVQELILHLNRTIYEQKHVTSPEEEQSLYRNLTQYIETYLDEDLSLDRLSKEFFVSKYHISHVFKENLGISIHQYITKKRLMLCRDALVSRQEISKLYTKFGFKDYSCFYRAFKKEFGMSPKEYRNSANTGSQTLS